MARSRTTNEVVASAADSSPKSLVQPAPVTGSDIARRAYDLGLDRQTAKSILDVMRLKNSA